MWCGTTAHACMTSAKTTNREVWIHISLLVIAIIIAYARVFQAGFMDWDDGEYVINNKDIAGFGAANIAAWFSRFYLGNYQPLTMLSYAVDHLLGGVQPLVYHVSSLLLHICTAVVVYRFINRLQPYSAVGLFVALLFALHPSHTESVSWIAERKTVLCALFYFLALYQHTLYAARPSGARLAGVLGLGVAAMLSKGVGVALPVGLIATDIWLQRDLKNMRAWLEKLPLFAAAFVIGLVAIKAQGDSDFLNTHPSGSAVNTIFYAGYAYVQYIIHFVVPAGLSVIYPYPQEVGALQYSYTVIAGGILALVVVAWRRGWHVLCGGILFYTANIVLVLQFVQFGEVLMADRYLYIACIGILFPLVYYGYAALQRASKQVVATVSGAAIALALLCGTYVRNDIWLSDFNFFNALLVTYPNSAVAHFSVGALYMKQGDYARAEEHMNRATEIDPNNYKAWYDKGMLYMRQKKVREAFEAFSRCLALKDYYKAYFGRALIYQSIGKPQQALADVDKAIEGQADNAKSYFLKAECLEELGDAPGAIDNYSRAIAISGKDPLFFIRRGMIYGKTRQNQPALADMDRAVALNPANGEALYFRGIVKYHAGQDPCADFRQALQYGYRQAQEALARACGH